MSLMAVDVIKFVRNKANGDLLMEFQAAFIAFVGLFRVPAPALSKMTEARRTVLPAHLVRLPFPLQ